MKTYLSTLLKVQTAAVVFAASETCILARAVGAYGSALARLASAFIGGFFIAADRARFVRTAPKRRAVILTMPEEAFRN